MEVLTHIITFLDINKSALYRYSIYVERMGRLWSLGRESIEEIYYLVMNPMEEDTPINMHFITGALFCIGIGLGTPV